MRIVTLGFVFESVVANAVLEPAAAAHDMIVVESVLESGSA